MTRSDFDCADWYDEDEEPREAALCYRWAREFHMRGLNIVPLKSRKKIPAVYWKELQTRRVTEDELRNWWPMFEGGLGFITGAISNAVVIESDGPEGEVIITKFEEVHGALPDTFTVRSGSGRGLHRYFRHPGYHVITRANKLIKLDVKGDRGFCVLPPSLHKSGGRYTILCGLRPAPLPERLLKFIEVEASIAKGESSRQPVPAPSCNPPSQAAHGRGQNANRCQPVPVNLVNVAIITSMLDALPDSYADDHDDWLRVGFALHSFDDGVVGLAMWRKFSQRCPDKAHKADFEARWSSFNRECPGPKITIGSLWKWASAHGWRPPRHWDRFTKIED